jgi:hypothetical protein
MSKETPEKGDKRFRDPGCTGEKKYIYTVQTKEP